MAKGIHLFGEMPNRETETFAFPFSNGIIPLSERQKRLDMTLAVHNIATMKSSTAASPVKF